MDASEAHELAALAASDFEQALRSGGAQEATSTLRSYLAEMRGAAESVLVHLAASFKQHAAAAVAACGGTTSAARRSPAALDLQPLLELQQLLLRVVAGCAPAEQEVQEAWSGSAAALLYGSSGEAPEAAIERLRSCTALLPALLAPSSLQHLPASADHQQRRSMLACLLHLQLVPPPGLPAGAAEALTALAVPPWFGSDPLHAKQQMAAAFEAFAAVMQHPAVRQRTGSGVASAQHPPAAGGEVGAAGSSTHEALRFLQLFKAPLPAATDLWWAHYAGLLHSIVAAAQAGGPLALRRPALQLLLRSLCCGETAHMVVQLLLAHPSRGSGGSGGEPAVPSGGRGRKRAGRDGGRKGGGRAGSSKKEGSPREALAMAATLLAHDVPAFLSGCCELLRPEANCVLGVRVEAIAAMDRAAGAYLDAHEGQEGAALRLWPAAALDHLLYALRSDPSIRVRREALRLLSSVAAEEVALLRAVLQRCRDKDEAVRQAVFALIVQFPQASLEQHLSLHEWQALLDAGLAGPLPSASAASASSTAGGRAAAKHAAAIREAAQQLLLRYLGLESNGDEGQQQVGQAGHEFVPPSDDEEEEGRGAASSQGEAAMEEDGGPSAGGDGCGGSGSASDASGRPPAWVSRLQALQALPPHAAGCPVAVHLAAAWQAALAAVLSPEQQAAAGIEGDAAAESVDDGLWE